VEEAAAVLRIGRTKAYAMAREWRATGGRSGLPVVDFGNALRVPRRALEQLIGAPITEIPAIGGPHDAEPPAVDAALEPARTPTPAAAPDPDDSPRASHRPATRPRRSRRAPTKPANQLDLFEPLPLPRT